MAKTTKSFLALLRGGNLGVPLVILCILAMVILPLPPALLDILFTFNIVLAVMVLLVAVSAKRPLEFSLFPTILLITTLMRLTLNVASTRVVLLHGHLGADAAGKVIESFGQVVIGGNFVVGFVVFIILMIINFIVVTKGAERISEVSARFTLDAMPGKQMAIDADLNAGLINQAQAQTRRKDVASEADFYGAMDGASKFVRGDAIAGMMILAINLIGGVCIGIFKYNLSADAAFQQYVLMTIGDGLVALPSSETYGEIDGVLGNDPAYGMPVTWIQPAQKAKALNMGYQVIDSASVIATHVNKIVRSYIPDLFNYDDITQLHNRLASMAPRLAEDLSAVLNYSQLLKVYRALLTEGVSLRDIVTIATVLVASSAVTKDHILLAADVRLALRRSITHPFVRKQELTVYTLNNELENLLTNLVNQAQQGGKVMLDSVPVDPNMLNQFQSTMPQVKEQMKAAGKDPVLLVPPQLRPLLARYARLFAPGLHVLSYNEVPDELELKIMGALS
ncbi:TPA: hypothetical protein J6425_003719 [Escherichia coli]|nr:hypothetical protein [Escherichia coli]